MISRVSKPSRSSASAWASACSLTPPMYDHENGTTMPDLHVARPSPAPPATDCLMYR